MFKNIFFRLHCLLLAISPFPEHSLASNMELEGYVDIQIYDEIRTMRKEFVIKRMFFFINAPDEFIDFETKNLMRLCDMIPSKTQFELVYKHYLKTEVATWLIKRLMRYQLKQLEANEKLQKE